MIVKRGLGAVAYGACFVLLVPIFILYSFRIVGFTSVSQCLSLIPTFWGMMLRRVWYKTTLRKCGKKLIVDFLGAIRTPKTEIGDNCYIGLGCWIGLATICDNVMVSGHTTVLSGSHQHGVERKTPMRFQEGKVERINIGSDVWIGEGSIIQADISEGCIVGSGSVVTHTFDKNSIIAGIPARLIKKR